mmetsp:Transcript_31518/g.32072  ORF Transcript_31518/g.32072 Transcript_31518/m.32072 type:complete len:115 (-) Transcript_31518:519-863(-)
MLSLGNLYFANLNISNKYDTHLKDSYKFYHHALSEEPRNAFAANGLGMICAEKRYLEMGRELFGKVRETNMCIQSDLCTNIANILLVQSRYSEAILMYQSAIKSLSLSLSPLLC